MAHTSSVTKNAFLSVVISASTTLLALITYPYLLRVLQPSGIGDTRFVQSVIGYFGLFATLGINDYAIRAISKVRDNKDNLSRTVSEIYSISLVTHTVTALVLVASLFFVPKFNRLWPLFTVFAVSMLIEGFNCEWLYRGLEKYTYLTVVSLMGKVISAVSVFLLVKKQDDLVFYSITLVFGNVLSTVCNNISLKKTIGTGIRLVRPNIKEKLQPVLIFFFITGTSILYAHMDVIMIDLLTSNVDNGYYDVGLKVKTILISISSSLWTVALPKATNLWDRNDVEEAKNFVKKGLHAIYAIQFPMVVFFMIFATPTVMLLGGEQYSAGISAMIFSLSSVFAIGVTNIIGGNVLMGKGHEKFILYSSLIGLLSNLLLNLLLIPQNGATGAAAATALSELIVLISEAMFIKVKLRISVFEPGVFAKCMLSCALGGAFSLFAFVLPGGNILKLVYGVILFAVGYLAVMIPTKDAIVFGLLSRFLHIKR